MKTFLKAFCILIVMVYFSLYAFLSGVFHGGYGIAASRTSLLDYIIVYGFIAFAISMVIKFLSKRHGHR